MQRIPEPEELMNDSTQAKAYAGADFSEANQLFVELLERLAMAGPQALGLQGRMLDLGCGPADIPLMLARRHPQHPWLLPLRCLGRLARRPARSPPRRRAPRARDP